MNFIDKKTSKKNTKKLSTKEAAVGKDYDRGRVEKVVLRSPFTLNGNRIFEAIIEIDHINYGLDKKRRCLIFS